MEVELTILIVTFFVLLVMNVPVAVAIGMSALLALASLPDQRPGVIVAQRMSSGIAQFPLLAIPFFVLAGNLMGEGGMARRLIDFASLLVGRLAGGLAYVSTLTCMMFGAISGSATAAVSSVGGMLIPEMQRKGYDRDFSVAVTTTSATTGLIIPPSNIMIVFAVVVGDISVAAMFMAGIVPGIVVGLCIMAVCWLATRGRSRDAEDTPAPHQADSLPTPASSGPLWIVLGALPGLLLIVIVLGGILGGVFSATEAAAIAVLYAFVFSVIIYREVKVSDLPALLLRAAMTTSVIFLLIGTSQAMSWMLAYENIPQSLASWLLGVSSNPTVILLVINIVLLIVGTFMDMTPAVLIFAPIFLPVVEDLGMDPVHFGIMMITNLCIGLCTPPVGTCLFVGCGVGKTTIANVTRPMLPFFVAMFVALMLITYIPPLSMWLPEVLGL